MNWLSELLGRSAGYLPHGYCFTWTPGLLWSMVGADAVIAAAYFSIPLAIASYLRRRKDVTANWLGWLFSAFIFSCGITHVMDIWTIWQPDYGLQALTKTVTAIVSIFTAIALWPLLPKALRIPTVAELRSVIASLESEVSKRRSAEENLAEIEQNLALTLAGIGAGFLSTDREGRVSRMNAVAERLLGWNIAEARGQAFWQVFLREDRPAGMRDMNPVDVLLRDRTTIDTVHHVVLISRDRRRTPVEARAALTETSDGSIRGVTVVFRDMGRLLQAEAEAGRLAAIVESSNDAIVGKTLQGIITSWNPGAERLYGYSAAEAVGQPMQMLIPAERQGEEPSILARLARGESVDHFETVRRRKDGSLIDVSTTISPVRASDGQVIGASNIARDITERKHQEERLLAQLQRLRLLDQITHAIGERQDLASIYQVAVRSLEDQLPADFSCVLSHDDKSGELIVSSQGVHDGVPALDELATLRVDGNGLSRCLGGELVYEEDTAEVPFPFAQRLAQAGLHSMVLAPLQSESRVFGVLLSARRAAAAFSSGECEFIRQLSAHVALAAHQALLHESLQQAFDELRQTQQAALQQERLRALGQMASGIAHDINNAISPAMLYAESLLEHEPLSERARGQVESISRAVDDVAATVARMREFYRAREPQLNLMPVKLNDLVRQVIDLSRARWSDMPLQRGIVIEVETDLDPALAVVWGVESDIREALINLVFNAVDAMPDGGTLSLRTRMLAAEGASQPRVSIEVGDNGIGMDEATRRRCLEPFFTTKGERGTGLGLAMVYGTAQRHEAEIRIDSAPGAGTTVAIVFGASEQTAAEAPAPLGRPRRGMRILIIDDDPALLRSLRDTLEADDHAVDSANGGQAGIDAFIAAFAAAAAPDVVITDLGMPHIDGRHVAAAIKRQSPTQPVLLLTGWGQRIADDGDLPEGVDMVLSKPPRLADLRAALQRSRGRRETP